MASIAESLLEVINEFDGINFFKLTPIQEI